MPVLLEMPVPTLPIPAAAPSPQGRILLRVLAALEREQIPWCLLHGYEQFPEVVKSDVDMLIPASFVPKRLAEVLHAHQGEIGAKVVQWFDDGAQFIVLAARAEDGSPILLQLHVASRYEMVEKVFFTADEILKTRRRHKEFWVPAPAVEFASILANRLAKVNLTDEHGVRLTRLHALDPSGCNDQARRLFPGSSTLVIEAASKQLWKPVQRAAESLSAELLASPAAKPAGKVPGAIIKKISRWLRPQNGFHAVFLGPDGVGKSTTIESFQRDLSPVFLSTLYLTFAPGLLPRKFAPPKPDGPHSLPPRSLPASLLKAAWWFVCYTFGYFASLHPTLARGGMVVNHRYLVDAIVDQKRYRYSGPVWLLKIIWAIAPKPDVVFLLDAEPEVIQRRKQEVPFAETAAQVQAYRGVIGKLSMGKIIDASQPKQQVASVVEWIVLDRLAERFARRFFPGGRA
jgi:thymidylate kinase